MQQSLSLNIIPFTPPITKAVFPFYKEYQESYCPVYIDTDLKWLLDGHLTKFEQADTFYLYTDFQEPTEGAINLEIDLTIHTEFSNHYWSRTWFIMLFANNEN